MVENIRPARKETSPQREPLSHEEMGNLLSAIGNSEAKALVVGEMKPGVIYTRNSLKTLANTMQGKHPGWLIDHGTAWHWCERSYEPIGVVARKITDAQNNIYGYSKTKYGEDVGVPLAGLLVNFSLRHPNISLYGLNGVTLSSSKPIDAHIAVEGEAVEFRKRAAATRLKIFWELATSSDFPIRLADLLEHIQEDAGAVLRNLKQLNDAGIISYSAIEGQKPFVAYRFLQQQPGFKIPHVKHEFTLSNRIVEIMSHLPARWLSLSDLADEVMIDDPTWKDKPERFHKALQRRISSVLGVYKSEGYAVAKDFQGKYRSKIELTEEQRKIITEYVTLLDEFQRQDPRTLKIGQEIITRLSSQEKAVLMAKAERNSPYGSNRSPYEETMPLVLDLVRDNPSLSPNQLRKLLDIKYGKKFTNGGILRVLNRMKDQKLVNTVLDRNTTRWRAHGDSQERAS